MASPSATRKLDLCSARAAQLLLIDAQETSATPWSGCVKGALP